MVQWYGGDARVRRTGEIAHCCTSVHRCSNFKHVPATPMMVALLFLVVHKADDDGTRKVVVVVVSLIQTRHPTVPEQTPAARGP